MKVLCTRSCEIHVATTFHMSESAKEGGTQPTSVLSWMVRFTHNGQEVAQPWRSIKSVAKPLEVSWNQWPGRLLQTLRHAVLQQEVLLQECWATKDFHPGTVRNLPLTPRLSHPSPVKRSHAGRGAACSSSPTHSPAHQRKDLSGIGCVQQVPFGYWGGGRWSTEATQFLRLLARSKAQTTPAPLRHAMTTSLLSRWSAIITHAAQHAYAASLRSLPADGAANGEAALPPLRHLLAQTQDAPAPSRLPGR